MKVVLAKGALKKKTVILSIFGALLVSSFSQADDSCATQICVIKVYNINQDLEYGAPQNGLGLFLGYNPQPIDSDFVSDQALGRFLNEAAQLKAAGQCNVILDETKDVLVK